MKKIFLCFLALFGSLLTKSQDPIFLNPNQSLLYLNPSFAGSNGGLRSHNTYNGQSSINLTLVNSVDAFIKKINGGIAFSYLHNDFAGGTFKTDIFSLSYAQHFSLREGRIKIIPSFSGSYWQQSLDISKLSFGEYYYRNPNLSYYWYPGISQKKSNADFNVGLLVNARHFYIGFTAFHITQPNNGFLADSKLPARLAAHASYNWHISKQAVLHFFAKYEGQGYFYLYQASATALLFRHLVVGAGIMKGVDSFVTTNLGFRHRYFTIQGSYGIPVNNYSNLNTWEISASFNLRNKDNRNLVTDFETW